MSLSRCFLGTPRASRGVEIVPFAVRRGEEEDHRPSLGAASARPRRGYEGDSWRYPFITVSVSFTPHAEIIAERLQTLRTLLPQISAQLQNATFLEEYQQTLTDIEWLILVGAKRSPHLQDVDNVEDLLKMGGESLLVQSLIAFSSLDAPSSLLTSSVVAVATFYKNALSVTDLSSCESALQALMEINTRDDASLQRKSFYAINAIVSHYESMAEMFVKHNGVRLLERSVMSDDMDSKRKALLLYRNLLSLFPAQPALSTANVCSQALQDLTTLRWDTQYALVESYVRLLQ